MDLAAFVPVLGHPRVLEALGDDTRRQVAVSDGDLVSGIAAYEPLFGQRAEGVVAIRKDGSDAILPYLVDALLDRTNAAGLHVVRFVFGSPDQHWRASRLAHIHGDCSVRRDWLDVRVQRSPALACTN